MTRHSSFIFFVLALLFIAWLDALVGAQINLWLLYGVPIGLATWSLGKRAGLLFTLLGGLLMIGVSLVWGHPFENLAYLAVACVSRICAYAVLVGLVSALRRKQVERVFIPSRSGS